MESGRIMLLNHEAEASRQGETVNHYSCRNLGLPRSSPSFFNLLNKINDSIAQPRATMEYALTPALWSRNKTRLVAGPKGAAPQIKTNGRYLKDFLGPKRYDPTLSMMRPSPWESARYETMKGIKAEVPITIAEDTNGFNSTI